MNAGDWIALASAAAAVAAAAIAISQARSARTAAEAASRQATAAEEQVAISRRQLEAELAARYEAEGPAFGIEDATEHWNGERFITATLVLQSGPTLAEIKIKLRGPDARSFTSSTSDYPQEYVREQSWHDVSPVARKPIVAMMEHEAKGPLHLTLELQCTERDGQHRTWNRTHTAVGQPEPPEPSRWERRRQQTEQNRRPL